MTNAGEALLHLETIKLLLQVAWADLEVESREAALILAKAEEMGLPPNALSENPELSQRGAASASPGPADAQGARGQGPRGCAICAAR